MEWIIAVFILLWLIGTLFGKFDSSSSSKSYKEPLDEKSTDVNKASDALLKENENPNQSTKLERIHLDCAKEEKTNPIALTFENLGVYSLWHITHRNNIETILLNGILSNTQAFNVTNPVDISDHSVQRWRDAKDPVYKRKIHDYAPTYFNVRNPMLYVRRDWRDELCLIEISLSVLSKDNFIFTDGNAAAKDTKFYNSLSDLINLPWDVLNASYWNNFEDGKRKRCAEVLVYPKIVPEYIKQIHCYSDLTLEQLANIDCRITKTKELFF